MKNKVRKLVRFVNPNTASLIRSHSHPAFGHPLPRGEGLGVRGQPQRPQRSDAHANFLMSSCLVVLLSLSFATWATPVQAAPSASATPISIHPKNPKYFLFRGKPLALITATEHYGSVVNSRFDFERYLQDAADKKQTLDPSLPAISRAAKPAQSLFSAESRVARLLDTLLAHRAGKGTGRGTKVRPRSMEPRLFCQAPPFSHSGFGVGHRCGSDPLQQYLRKPCLGAQSAPF